MPTTGLDNAVGTSADDTFVGGIDTAGSTVNTLSALDAVNGGEGKDTLKIAHAKGATFVMPGMTSIEVVQVQSTGDVEITTTITGIEQLNVTQAEKVTLEKVAAATAVAVTGATGDVVVEGGSTVNVASNTKDQTVTITGSKGAVTVTATKDAGTITVDGGTDVTVTSTVTTTTGTIDATKATGAVVVTQNINSDGSAAVNGSDITTEGGTTVTINVNANSVATEASKDDAITIGAISATADDKTTAITVNQNDTVTTFSSAAKAEVVATETVKFDAVVADDVVKVGTLEFKAAKALTAAEVAAAFADLTAADTQSAGGLVTNGTYAGSLTAGWTSAAASGDTVVFTGAAHDTATLAATGDGIKEAKFEAGTDKAAAVATINTVDFGAVTVVGGKALTSLTLNGYKSADVTAADALTTLSLTDSDGAATVEIAESTTLALTVNNVKHEVALTASNLATLNLTTAGKDSEFKLSAAATKTLTVTGDKAAKLDGGSAWGALETVTVSGTAGLDLGTNPAGTLKSVDTTATTGTVEVHIDGAKATYKGGAGVDRVYLETATALTKAIDLGAGDDTLSFQTLAVTGSTASLNGGEGTDTLAMSSKAAESLSGAAVTFITGFERLTINDNVSAKIDLANLGFTNYVTTSGGTLELNNLANNGTVVVTKATTALNVGIKDAATGTADALNFVLSSEAALAGNTLTAAKVETVKIVSNDTDKTAHNNVLALTADKATTVTVAGNAGLELTVTGSTLVSLIDGSASTGGLKAATNASAAAATTVKGGTGADDLTANRNQDVLEGGAGKDTLTVATGVNLATLRGGAGQDTYVIGVASNSNGYATIEGAAVDLAGDTIQFTAAITGFSSAKIVLGATAVFQDYANEAAKAGAAGSVSWFQWAGDTYLVQDNDAATSFLNGTDAIVKIMGTAVNFSFNSDVGILEII